MGDTNQFSKNIGHQNKKLDQILKHLHLFGTFPKSPIKKYSDQGFDLNVDLHSVDMDDVDPPT